MEDVLQVNDLFTGLHWWTDILFSLANGFLTLQNFSHDDLLLQLIIVFMFPGTLGMATALPYHSPRTFLVYGLEEHVRK